MNGQTTGAISNGKTPLLRFFRLVLPFWSERGCWWPRLLLIGMLSLGAAQVALAIRLNTWSADLFDALERRSAEGLLSEVMIFGAIVVGVMVVNAVHLTIKRRLQLDWRDWLTAQLVERWMDDGTAFRIGLLPGSHSNADGRIAEDIRITTEAAVDLAHSLFYCLLLLISFSSILWALSGTITFGPDDAFSLPGHMVFLALIYSGGGSLIAMFIGRRLVTAADSRQTSEADLRSALVHARDAAEAIAVADAASRERSAIHRFFAAVIQSWNSQTSGLRQLILFSSAYSTLAAFFPILVCIPRYLLGELTLGGLMQTAQAFQQTTSALSWPVDNFPRIAELRASMERVLELHDDIIRVGAIRASGDLRKSRETRVELKAVILLEPDGRPICLPINLSIAIGERVQITGDPHTAGVLCKAIAGHWPWFEGSIETPEAAYAYIQPQPYPASGAINDLLAFPGHPEDIEPGACRDVLHKVGLSHLASQMQDKPVLAEDMSPDDQRLLVFARVLLRRPTWIIMEEALESLSDDAQERLSALIPGELPQALILASDHRPIRAAFFTRTLTLASTKGGALELREMSSPELKPGPRRNGRRVGRLLHWVRAGFGES